jgi:hypothetical protein
MLCVTVASVPYVGFQLVKIVVFDLADEVRNHISHIIPGGWMSTDAPIAWPFQSLDFFLWHNVNNLTYQLKNNYLLQSKAHIWNTAALVTHNKL